MLEETETTEALQNFVRKKVIEIEQFFTRLGEEANNS